MSTEQNYEQSVKFTGKYKCPSIKKKHKLCEERMNISIFCNTANNGDKTNNVRLVAEFKLQSEGPT